MRIYCFGDLHGNLHALDACLRHMDGLRPDRVYCLGDLVGWLPFGDRTFSRMRSMQLPTVAGNHDLLVAGLFTDHPHQVDRMQATAYNAGLLSHIPDAPEYLLSLPLILEGDDYVVTHHSPFHLPESDSPPNIECFNYLDEAALEGCLNRWNDFSPRIIFSGHDHIPAVYELPGGIDIPTIKDVGVHRPSGKDSLTIQINPASKYWVKAGSVGGPYRDGVPTANSVLWDTAMESVTLSRIPYPCEQLLRDLTGNRFCCNIPTIQKYVGLLRRDST